MSEPKPFPRKEAFFAVFDAIAKTAGPSAPAPSESAGPSPVVGSGGVVGRDRPSALAKGVLLAARWLIEYGETSQAAYMLRDMGYCRLDLRSMDESDQQVLAVLNGELGFDLLFSPNSD